jgi:hypothetical protein
MLPNTKKKNHQENEKEEYWKWKHYMSYDDNKEKEAEKDVGRRKFGW